VSVWISHPWPPLASFPGVFNFFSFDALMAWLHWFMIFIFHGLSRDGIRLNVRGSHGLSDTNRRVRGPSPAEIFSIFTGPIVQQNQREVTSSEQTQKIDGV
jgi:hypothetical protein